MCWWLEWGEHFDKFQAMAAQGIHVPALSRMPQLPDYAEAVARAYADLRGERSMSGALQWSAVMAWARAVGMRDPFWLWDALQAADADITKWLARKSNSQKSGMASRLKSTQ